MVRLVWACKSGVGGGWAGMLVHRLCLLWYFRLEGLKKALSLDRQPRKGSGLDLLLASD